MLSLRAVLRTAQRTICVSESEHAELARAVGARAARDAVVVRNGVPVPQPIGAAERQAIRATLGIDADEVVAIWVGSLDERKDPLAAARAAEEANVTLLVVGDGPLRGALERADHAWVRVLGRRHDVPRLLAASDVFVLTSQREGLSFSLLEAMAHGLVPVVTDLPENVEAVGDAGTCVGPGHELLATALRHLATDEDVRADLGIRAVRRVAGLFSATVMRAKTQALYGGALG